MNKIALALYLPENASESEILQEIEWIKRDNVNLIADSRGIVDPTSRKSFIEAYLANPDASKKLIESLPKVRQSRILYKS